LGPRALETHPRFGSELLGNERTIHVHTPPGYDEGEERYPVLYLQDGQNLFDPRKAAFGVEWRAGRTADRLEAQGRIEPVIIVGVANTPQRMEEYGPPLPGGKGRANDYVDFLTDELKPFIDDRYRTRIDDPQDTGIGGSSMGGLVSLYACMRRPEVFGKCAALSPAVWWPGREFTEGFEAMLPALRHVNFRVVVGMDEDERRRMLQGARWIRDAFKRSGHPRWRYRELANGQHNEAAWSRQLPLVLAELFSAH
jgi:enterochelin esterase-like enzyme